MILTQLKRTKEQPDPLAGLLATCMCVWGSVALYNPWFVELVREKARELVLNPATLRLELARRGADAGLLGASLLVR